jgi:hypothetical protein
MTVGTPGMVGGSRSIRSIHADATARTSSRASRGSTWLPPVVDSQAISVVSRRMPRQAASWGASSPSTGGVLDRVGLDVPGPAPLDDLGPQARARRSSGPPRPASGGRAGPVDAGRDTGGALFVASPLRDPASLHRVLVTGRPAPGAFDDVHGQHAGGPLVLRPVAERFHGQSLRFVQPSRVRLTGLPRRCGLGPPIPDERFRQQVFVPVVPVDRPR